jgi:hypothetical protein
MLLSASTSGHEIHRVARLMDGPNAPGMLNYNGQTETKGS